MVNATLYVEPSTEVADARATGAFPCRDRLDRARYARVSSAFYVAPRHGAKPQPIDLRKMYHIQCVRLRPFFTSARARSLIVLLCQEKAV